MILIKLFLAFIKIGFLAYGGGYSVISLISDEIVVINNWLTSSEFFELISIAQITPGPIAINSATFVGYKIAGIAGAGLATIGILIPSVLIITIFILITNSLSKNNAKPIFGILMGSVLKATVILVFLAGLKLGIDIFNDMKGLNWDLGLLLPVIATMMLTFVLLNLKRKIKVYKIVLSAGLINIGLSYLFHFLG